MASPKWVVVGALALLLGTAGPAAAHARLLSTTPAAGSTLVAAPSEVRLTFDGPPSEYGLGVVVTSPAGEHLETGRVTVDGSTVVQPLKALSIPGTYTVSWRVVSADGHPVSDTYVFAFEPDGLSAGAVSDPGVASGSGGGAHGWLLLGLAGLAVVVLIALLILPGRRRQLKRTKRIGTGSIS